MDVFGFCGFSGGGDFCWVEGMLFFFDVLLGVVFSCGKVYFFVLDLICDIFFLYVFFVNVY